MKQFCNIKDEEKNLIKDLTILFKIEKYKFDIDSMIFFFECLRKKDENWEKKEWIEKLNEYKNLSIEDFENTKIKITELFDKKILTNDDEDNKGYYNKLFTCLYDKKEAIDFLIDKIGENIDNLKEKIDPTNTTVNFENISDTKACIRCIDDMRKMKDYELIFGKIKN